MGPISADPISRATANRRRSAPDARNPSAKCI